MGAETVELEQSASGNEATVADLKKAAREVRESPSYEMHANGSGGFVAPEEISQPLVVQFVRRILRAV